MARLCGVHHAALLQPLRTWQRAQMWNVRPPARKRDATGIGNCEQRAASGDRLAIAIANYVQRPQGWAGRSGERRQVAARSASAQAKSAHAEIAAQLSEHRP